MKNALAARWNRILSSDIAWSFFNSPGAMIQVNRERNGAPTRFDISAFMDLFSTPA